jgi:hypothetical protein
MAKLLKALDEPNYRPLNAAVFLYRKLLGIIENYVHALSSPFAPSG